MIPRAARVLRHEPVELEREPLDLVEALLADELDGRVAVDVLVVPGLRLRRRREDRLGQLRRLREPGRQRVPADRAGREVVLPARAGEVAADDALDRQHLEPPALGRAPVVAQREQVVRHERPRVCANQNAESPVSTRPLSGISVGSTTSKVEMRSLATSSSRSSSSA